MNNPLGVSPSEGNQRTTRGKEKSFDLGRNRTHDLRIRSTITLPTELRGRTEKIGDDLGGESRRRESSQICTYTNCLVKTQRRSQGPLSTSRKYPGYGWSRVYACQPKLHRGLDLDLILSLLSREVNVSLLRRHNFENFEREASYLSEILPDQCFILT